MSIRYTSDQLQRKFPGPAGSAGFARVADGMRSEGRLDEAIALCQEGLRIRPVLSGYVVLGKALMDANRMDEAREQFEAALRIDPRCLSAMHMLARIMNKLQWGDAAAGYYRSILEVEPWDAEIRALLGETAQAGYASGSAANSPYAPAAPAEETFEKPAGFDGDVLEVNLNEMAADFLPAGDATGSAGAMEDALAAGTPDASPFLAAAPDAAFHYAPAPESLTVPPADPSNEAADAPPISGQDVEDRLDSLFGSEDAAPMADNSTWTPAPAHPDSPFESSATATGEMRSNETGEMPAQVAATRFDLASVPEAPTDLPSQFAPEDYSAVDFGAPAVDAPAVETPGVESDPGDAAAFEEGSGRVHGEDIERRLDELFSLTEEADRPPARALSASDLPVAPGPRLDEAVYLGETVSFGISPAVAPAHEADTKGTAGTLASDFALASATTAAPAPQDVFGSSDDEPPAFFTAPGPQVAAPGAEGGIVTGQDVADKLDTLFGIESAAPAARAPETAPAFPEPKPWAPDNEPPPPPPTGDLMSTESLLPPGWFGDAGDGPRVTGADVESQLDMLFNLGDEPETPAFMSNVGNTVSFVEPEPPSPSSMIEDNDRTMVMPAMKDPSTPAAPKAPADAGRLRETVADWLSRQDEAVKPAADFQPDYDGGDTLILPAGDSMDEAQKDFDVDLVLPNVAKTVADDMESFGTLAPEDMGNLSDTTASIEMVDGGDVADRLDRLFAGPGDAGVPADSAAIPEMSLFAQDGEPSDAPASHGALFDASGTLELPVTGTDVSSRLHELFDAGKATGADTQSAPSGLTHGSETDEESASAPIGAASGASASHPTPDLAPMLDEEEGYPEDEEMPAQDAAGANVATVTLAEIYFQQGLREQALQIYRQLLEREPENDTVRKRIGEIEAAKPEGGDRDPGSDPRRPRPGLKVPKRKK